MLDFTLQLVLCSNTGQHNKHRLSETTRSSDHSSPHHRYKTRGNPLSSNVRTQASHQRNVTQPGTRIGKPHSKRELTHRSTSFDQANHHDDNDDDDVYFYDDFKSANNINSTLSVDGGTRKQSAANQLAVADVSPSSSKQFQCPEQFGYYADQSDCAKYFVCVFGDPLHETCTGGLYFSSELQTCDWPNNVICSNTVQVATQDINFDSKNTKNGIKSTEPSGGDDADGEGRVEDLQAPNNDYNANDLFNPNYEESIRSYVDQNGDVYLHDDPQTSGRQSSNALLTSSSSVEPTESHRKPLFSGMATTQVSTSHCLKGDFALFL